VLDRFLDRFLHNGYAAALSEAVDAIIARYARGSIGIQDERLLDQVDADTLHRNADKASQRMNARIAKHRR
jgi:hypothetical protein